jgi:catechol 2,3-dioxygenase-like lactoylglutathione lyase family enzyme
MIRGLHHNAYRCRNSEETRRFYEDFLGLRLASAIPLDEPGNGRKGFALHTFFELGDGSYLAFFEVPGRPFDFKRQDTLDLHIALEVTPEDLDAMFERGRAEEREVRGIVDHGFVRSIYFRDPNGYVIELTAKVAGHEGEMDPTTNGARRILEEWQTGRR